MYNLPLESKLDIFKYLNINQLTSVRQTNYYFNALIGRYEGELARKKFYKIGISDFFKDSNDTFINLEDGLFKLKITDKLMEKWKSAVDRQIPVYLNKTTKSQNVIKIYKESGYNDTPFVLNLPMIPKNIEEIKIIRCWLEKISLCYFNDFKVLNTIFNPEFIQFIFENEEIDKIKFNCYSCYYLHICEENLFLFNLNRLVISECFWINFSSFDRTFKQKEINNLFKFLLKIAYVSIFNSSNSAICKMMLNFIETSKDYSNMAKDVEFVFCFWPIFNLSERAEFIKREQYSVGWRYFYQLTNKHNPKVKFSILYIVRNELISHFKIVRIN